MPRSREDDYLISVLKSKLDESLERNRLLEEENQELKKKLSSLSSQLDSFRTQAAERKGALLKKFQRSGSDNSSEIKQKTIQNDAVDGIGDRTLQGFTQKLFRKRDPMVPNPPPKASSNLPKPTTTITTTIGGKEAPPPPPPPPPPKLLKTTQADRIQRAPEVIELYQILTRSEGKIRARMVLPGTPPCLNTKEMIGEIENRSSYVLAIKSDVETQGDFIKILAREIQDATHRDISDIEAFVKWLDGELSSLADERAVLKHFTWWPEQKVDAMREAACSYRDLRNLESEVSTFRADLRQPVSARLKSIQMLQDKLEHGVHAVQRVRESAIRKYKQLQIPWEWLQDKGMISNLKGCSLKLGKEYMKTVVIELKSITASEEELLTLQGVRFMFRIHQFIGGLDAESRRIFQELKKAVNNYHGHVQNQTELTHLQQY